MTDNWLTVDYSFIDAESGDIIIGYPTPFNMSKISDHPPRGECPFIFCYIMCTFKGFFVNNIKYRELSIYFNRRKIRKCSPSENSLYPLQVFNSIVKYAETALALFTCSFVFVEFFF